MRRTIWDFWAPRYEDLWAQSFALGPSRALMHEWMAEFVPSARRVLDVGCGAGQFARELVERMPRVRVMAVDPSPMMIKRATTDYVHERITYINGYLGDVPRGGGFDAIVSCHALPYVSDAVEAFCCMKDLLREGGRIAILHGNTENLWDRLFLTFVKVTTTRATYYSTRTLRSLLKKAGLCPGEPRPLRTWFFVPSIHLVQAER